MGAHEDFMAMRRAASQLERKPVRDKVEQVLMELLREVSARELSFIRTGKEISFGYLIDIAYGVLGEERPGGPAVAPQEGQQ